MELGTDLFTTCKKALQEAAKQQSNNIAYGGAESFSDYRYSCGIVKGLDLALTIVEEVLTKLSKENSNQ